MEEKNAKKPIFIIVTGTNGVGKSTLGKKLSKKLDFPFLNTDLFYFSKYGQYRDYTKDEVIETSKELKSIREQFFAKQQSFIVEKILNNTDEVEYLIKQAKENGFETSLVYIGVKNIEKSVDRVNDRYSNKKEHFVKQNIIEKNLNDCKKNFSSIANKVDSVLVYDNTKKMERIYSARKGEILKVNSNMATWSKNLLADKKFKEDISTIKIVEKTILNFLSQQFPHKKTSILKRVSEAVVEVSKITKQSKTATIIFNKAKLEENEISPIYTDILMKNNNFIINDASNDTHVFIKILEKIKTKINSLENHFLINSKQDIEEIIKDIEKQVEEGALLEEEKDMLLKHILDIMTNKMQQTNASLIEVKRRSITDPLTGLLNNAYYNSLLFPFVKREDDHVFIYELKKYIANLTENNLAIGFVDFANFKKANEFGHDKADNSLAYFGKKFLNKYQEDAFKIIRRGGDEFVIIASEKVLKKMQKDIFSDKTVGELSEPFIKEGGDTHYIQILASLGIQKIENENIIESLKNIRANELSSKEELVGLLKTAITQADMKCEIIKYFFKVMKFGDYNRENGINIFANSNKDITTDKVFKIFKNFKMNNRVNELLSQNLTLKEIKEEIIEDVEAIKQIIRVENSMAGQRADNGQNKRNLRVH